MQEDGSQDEATANSPAVESDSEGDKPKRRRRARGGAKAMPVEENFQDRLDEHSQAGEVAVVAALEPAVDEVDVAVVAETAPGEKPKRVRKPRKTKAQREAEEAAAAKTIAPKAAAEEAVVAEESAPEVAVEKPAAKPKRVRKPAAKKAVPVEESSAEAPAPEAVEPDQLPEALATPVAHSDPAPLAAEPEPEKPAAPKKRGWWSRG
jgi:ribonuclease E